MPKTTPTRTETTDTQEKRLVQLRALADPTRLKILELLKKPGCCSVPAMGARKAGMCVCDLTGPLALTQPTVTHHLKVLREAGLVECEKIGAWLYCRINSKTFKELGVALARV